MSTTGREVDQQMTVVPLQHAVFCVNCETVSNSPHDVCSVCGSRSLVSLFRMLGTLRGKNQHTDIVKYNLELIVRVSEVSGTDLNHAIDALTRLAQAGKDLQTLHMHIESVVSAHPERALEAAA